MHNDLSYRETKDGKTLIAWCQKTVVTLKGNKAQPFIKQTHDADAEELQLLMARVTGNFKRGNERVCKEKNR
ncbi:MAG: hypothetical protein ACKVJG_17685 [Candidatus Latescibacterota bacterium]|jgi:hypothetical protein